MQRRKLRPQQPTGRSPQAESDSDPLSRCFLAQDLGHQVVHHFNPPPIQIHCHRRSSCFQLLGSRTPAPFRSPACADAARRRARRPSPDAQHKRVGHGENPSPSGADDLVSPLDCQVGETTALCYARQAGIITQCGDILHTLNSSGNTTGLTVRVRGLRSVSILARPFERARRQYGKTPPRDT